MCHTRKVLVVLTGLVLLSLLGVASCQVDWGYGWNGGPTYPPTITPTPTSSPTTTPQPTVTTNPTAQPTQQVNPIQSTNPTPKPTSTIPESNTAIIIIAFIFVSIISLIYVRRIKNEK